MELPDAWRWFADARWGLFIHWGPYSLQGRGEQVLFREHLDQAEYARAAMAWNPSLFDADQWAAVARDAGFRYTVLTTRHHDGFCLWNSTQTDYTSQSSCGRDLVAEWVTAQRAAGLRVGLYYSLADWRIPAYWEGPAHDPAGWVLFRDYVHAQLRELLTRYGQIDVLWFDGAWPHSARDWGGAELLDELRRLQPGILINNRLGLVPPEDLPPGHAGDGRLGDFGTPEHQITAEAGRLWESCQVSTWRLWGYTIGERWRPADLLLDMLIECLQKGGNLILNVGPTPDGELPVEFRERAAAIGEWLRVHEELLAGDTRGEVCEFITYGRQLTRGRHLYLVIRFWDGRPSLRLAGLATPVESAELLTTGQSLPFEQTGDTVTLHGLPATSPTPLFPVIKLTCAEPPRPAEWARQRLWTGDPRRMTAWAAARGRSVWADGRPR